MQGLQYQEIGEIHISQDGESKVVQLDEAVSIEAEKRSNGLELIIKFQKTLKEGKTYKIGVAVM